MISKLLVQFKHSSLEQKLDLIVSLIIILIVGTSSFLSFLFIKQRYESMLYQSMATSSSLITHELSNSLQDVVLLSDVIRSDTTIQNHLDLINQKKDFKKANSYTHLYAAQQTHFQRCKQPFFSYSALINPNFISYTYGYGFTHLTDQTASKILETASLGKGAPVWMSDYTDLNQLFLVRQIRKIKDLSLENIGTVAIAVDMDALIQEITKESKDYQHIDWVFSQGDHIVYTSDSLSNVTLENIRSLKKSYGPIKLNGHSYFALKGQLESPNWDYFQLVPYDELAHSQTLLILYYVLIFALSLGLTIFLIHISIRYITSDIGILYQKMKSFRGDNADLVTIPYDYSGRTDEIALLHQYFDSMAKEIETLINNEYKIKIEIKNMQLKSLAAQMNPHFLYNTLESINWRAKAAGNAEISQMAESLGTLLRASLSKPHPLVPLKEELELVKCYLTIQKIRYEERLLYSYEMNEEFLPVMIPPLSIQPLVENAIKYGLEEMVDDCHIKITTYQQENDSLVIRVCNNGSLFEDQLLEKLQNSPQHAHGLGIGLLNINQRIKLLFGPEYGIQLYNEREYAIAAIHIPILRDEVTYAEINDCR